MSLEKQMIETGEATAILPVENDSGKPITVIGTEKIRHTFGEQCLRQAMNSRMAPGVTDIVLNPDAHVGYGAPVGCVLVSPSHIYPGPVGVDIKCSMSLLQTDVPEDQLKDRVIRRKLINAICERTPTGAGRGQRHVKKSRKVSPDLGRMVAIEGASANVCNSLGIPPEWAGRCEDSFHLGHDDTSDALAERIDYLVENKLFPSFANKITQLGSYGGGNHFGECEIVRVRDNDRARAAAETFGLKDGCAAFLSHCGSRGFGFKLAQGQFKAMESHFDEWGIPYPAGDRHLVFAPLGTKEANLYLDDMSMGANFATVNHLLINALVLDAFQEVIPGTKGWLVYFISHNIARLEPVGGKLQWVHRKGATRAFPGDHPSMKGTLFEGVGHPILLPGNPLGGSAVMVGESGAEVSAYSVNHGAGRALGRRAAFRELKQSEVDASFEHADVLTNCRNYPRDEAPDAYKDFGEVIRSVEKAGLASTVADLKARFVIKDADKSQGGAA